jgi:hypothetical protein
MARNRKIQRAEKMAEQAALQQVPEQPLAHRLLANLTANQDPAARDAYEDARDTRINEARAKGNPQTFGEPIGEPPPYDEWGQDIPAAKDTGKEDSGGRYTDVPEEALGSSKDIEELKAKVDELAKKVEANTKE